MTTEQKLTQIRKVEGLTQAKLAEEIGISVGTIRNYETGQKGVGLSIVSKFTNHPQFKKYTLWLMTGDLAASTVQIAPRFLSGEKDDDQ
ncbi:helix-turn-helix transcriptional regulator [Salmonella enterica]|nr:helix-turn-helix transcriptional regulator [Salmonella enterica]